MLDDSRWKMMSLEGYRGHSETVAFLAEGSHLTLGFECPLSGKQTLKIQFSAAANDLFETFTIF